MLAVWACGAIYAGSLPRTASLSVWLDRYKYRRSRGALSHRPPVNRLCQLSGDRLLGSHGWARAAGPEGAGGALDTQPV